MIEPLGAYAGLVVVVCAALAAVWHVTKALARFLRQMDALNTVVQRELNHNHGTSMKDDTHGTALSMHELANRVTAVEDTLADHLRSVGLTVTNAVYATERAADVADAAAHGLSPRQGRHKT